MGVIFGFQAFKDKNSDSIDSIFDDSKTLTTEIFGTVPASLEQISRYGDSDLYIYDYYEYLKKMATFGFTENDFDFIMNTNTAGYDGIKCHHFFDAKDCHNKFLKFTNYFQQHYNEEWSSRLLNIDTNEYILGPVVLNGSIRTYSMYEKLEFQEQLSTISSVEWSQGRPIIGEVLNCKIVDLTVYEYHKQIIDEFSNFFLKHSKEKNLIQGVWQ